MLRSPGKLATAALLVFAVTYSKDTLAQAHGPQRPAVVMFSDIHFDPFRDPAKFKQLQSSPTEGWAAILAAPDSPTQAQDFDSLQTACKAHDVDTDWALLASSLKAARAAQPDPLFVTVSGDLLAHQFDCRFRTLAAGASDSAYSDFAAKTVAFVALEMKRGFPGRPVYAALGNNDSGCADYGETPDSAFLHAVAQSFAADVDRPNRAEVLREFPHLGDYDVALPRPMGRTRLIVLQDVFQSYRYETCGGAADRSTMQAQNAWLAQHLAQARARGEHVWVMAHIPPGVHVYTTSDSKKNLCTGKPPAMFLSSEQLVDTLLPFADVVRFVVFAHTHDDEMRLLAPEGGGGPDGRGTIPAKLVPSISPVHGNNPAFTVAAVDPRTANVADYRVMAASNKTGLDTEWREEYRYSEAYKEPDFSAASVAHLVQGFSADTHGSSAMSRDYEHWYSVGGGLPDIVIASVWPAYVCSLTHNQPDGFRQCLCAAGP
ncbi:MAG TPA: metallophosphoesterase [Acidobacteriaceae bacterium]|jgi:sphingomyelin phosphodiesterase acid-like 3|nr:metallophosphoesterase [Acidobacteriaceae bacterium]